MLKAGIQFGHRKDRKHPKIEPFIYGTRNDVLLIDVIKTREFFEKALDYLKKKKKDGAVILFVATKNIARELVVDVAKDLKMPYITERWLGGILTNFEIIKRQLDKLEGMEQEKKEGESNKYTKKERLRKDQSMEKIKRKIGGLRTLKRLPDILFVVDVQREKTAILEAGKKKIPIVGICDTNGDPSSVDFPIPANDDAPSALAYIFEKIKKELK
ncbi:MAG: 30S ribosomal protein S2 [Candidatus Bathyarchaeota archaeon]|nr:30S ribosomal protein S2 [Candidatus Bathyarchaeota archaeon]